MAEYLPLFKPGQSITRTTSAAVVGGQLLIVSGSNTVGPSTGPTVAWVGVAAFDAASGADVTVHKGGVQRMTASGAITAGDQVVPAAAGRVSALAASSTALASDINSTRQVVGIALNTAADGIAVDIDFVR